MRASSYLVLTGALLLMSGVAVAKDWRVEAFDQDAAASTVDKNNNEFGIVCRSKGTACFWVLRPEAGCITAGPVDLTIRTDGLPTPSKGVCYPKDGEEPAFVAFLEFEQLAQLVPLSDELSFESSQETGLNSGPFNVRGAPKAIQKLVKISP